MVLKGRFHENRYCRKLSFVRSVSRNRRMNSYSNEELVGMMILCRAADCNGYTAWSLYQERYPNRRIPHHKTFAIKDLIVRISVAAGRISDMPGIFENVRNSVQHRCQAYHSTSGRNFEHLL
ncbi:hypothetical protein TNCV_1662771 [Trichonephila clavipes]|nr:hypothetical protein TNCV_1662771 [Trichonephila clavipes]